MNTNKKSRPSVNLYVDGVCMGRFFGWTNIRTAEARYADRGAVVARGEYQNN